MQFFSKWRSRKMKMKNIWHISPTIDVAGNGALKYVPLNFQPFNFSGDFEAAQTHLTTCGYL